MIIFQMFINDYFVFFLVYCGTNVERA